MSTVVMFFVDGSPVGYDRSAAALKFTPKDVKDWRELIRFAYAEAITGPNGKIPEARAPIAAGEYIGPVEMIATFYGTKGDDDNLLKEVQDALKGLAYKDDAQVVDARVILPTRVFGPKGGVKKPADERPGVQVTITFPGFKEVA